MRYRALDENGDYSFGYSAANFLVDSPDTVAQAVQTRLGLIAGEWFLDTTEGTPYYTEILGKGTYLTYDNAIQTRILGTPGVVSLVAYSSSVNGRSLVVSATVDTIYGQIVIKQVL